MLVHGNGICDKKDSIVGMPDFNPAPFSYAVGYKYLYMHLLQTIRSHVTAHVMCDLSGAT